MQYKPYPYQAYTTQRIIDGSCGPLLDMGLGKTVATLTAIRQLIDEGKIRKTLVIAPLTIAKEVWTDEIEKWDHLRSLTVSKILGSAKQRKQALREKADIYIINRDNTAWLVSLLGTAFKKFDMVVLDESSGFKNPQSQRFRAIRQVSPLIKRKYILTGTPTPNGLLGLWSQIYFLDRGKRLGDSYEKFRDTYFQADKRDQYKVFSYKIKAPDRELYGEGIMEKEIHGKVADICFSMKSEDYLQLPERMDRMRSIHLDSQALSKYKQFERDQVLALPEAEITALSAAALVTKLLQFANGAAYDEDGAYHLIHDSKLDALEEIVESAAAEGSPVLVFYSFKHDLDRLRQRFCLFDYAVLNSKNSTEVKEQWNAKKLQIMFAHPASAGHGLNLQAGGNIIVWFGLPYSLEYYQQANKRLHRMGQQKPVIIHHLLSLGTIDTDVMEALMMKAGRQEALIRAVKARVEVHRKAA